MAPSLDIMIAGVQKAGTTSLAHYLGQHPRIVGHEVREMPYFVRDALYEREFESVFRDYYPEEIREDQRVLAKSVGIAYDETAARRLREHSPNCKILIVLRDPVERAYSAYWYMRRVGWETAKTFEAALEAEEGRADEGGTVAVHCSYRARGRYEDQVARLWRIFGPEQVRVLLLRDLQAEPMVTCQSLFRFADVDPTFQPSVTEKRNASKKARSEWMSRLLTTVFQRDHVLKRALRIVVPSTFAKKVRHMIQEWNESDFSPPPMDAGTRQALAEYFESHNQSLEAMIGRSLDHWTHVEDVSNPASERAN